MPQYPAPRLSNRLTAMAASLLCNLSLAAFIAVPDASAFAAEVTKSPTPRTSAVAQPKVVQLPTIVIQGKRSGVQAKNAAGQPISSRGA
jgi:hypothetical protein